MSETRQQEVFFDWRDVRLAGTLHLPPAPSPHPVVLMLQGSGPADRDSDGFFNMIREAFLDRGIAAYSFDKPGIGGSSGDWRNYDLADRTDQALAAIKCLCKQVVLDPNRVGVWGHSQGGWLVQMLAAQRPELAFAISNSGPAISPDQQDLAGCEHTMRAAGKSEADIRAALAFTSEMHRRALSGDNFEIVDRELLQAARNQPWYGYLTIDDAAEWDLACRFAQDQYEPVEAIEQITCPFLAIFGELDPLVPAWESAMIYGRTLRTAGNQDATIVVFPQGNHRILIEETGEFVSGYLDLLADWAARRVAAT